MTASWLETSDILTNHINFSSQYSIIQPYQEKESFRSVEAKQHRSSRKNLLFLGITFFKTIFEAVSICGISQVILYYLIRGLCASPPMAPLGVHAFYYIYLSVYFSNISIGMPVCMIKCNGAIGSHIEQTSKNLGTKCG